MKEASDINVTGENFTIETHTENSKEIKKNKCSLLTCILLIIIFVLTIACFILTYFLVIKKDKEKREEKEKNEEKEEKDEEKEEEKEEKNEENKISSYQNSIVSTYDIKAGKEMSFLNPYDIALKNEDYTIEEIQFTSEGKNKLRLLKAIKVSDGKFIPSNSGILSAKINFKNNLKSLDSLFKDNKDIIKVNLSNLNMSEITSMKSTFSGCSNLSEINFDGINTSKLVNIAKTFENCTELKTLDLSPINTTNLVNMENLFSGCNKLETINLSSFYSINNNIFYGIKSKPNIIANDLISDYISKAFYDLFSININIVIVTFFKTNCVIGEKEKCKTCSKKIKTNCLTCNEGYYLPYHEMDNKKCLPCNIIENCASCFGEKDYTVCLACESGYILTDNKCEDKKTIQICEIGDKEKCKTCKSDPMLQNECETCNEGYYLSEDNNKTICEICDIEGCLECFGSKNCSKCQNGYNLINNECIKETCIIGENEKCSSCKNETGKEKECATCNEGYFIDENSNSSFCQKCTIQNCDKCSLYLGKEICMECKSNFIGTQDINGNIENCSCPSDHKLIDSLCLDNNNWIEVEYNITDSSSEQQLMNTLYTNIELVDIDAYINNSLILLTKNYSTWDKPIFFHYHKNGLYKIKINIKKTLYDMSWMFTNLRRIKSIKFLPGFDSSNVKRMESIFACTSIESLDMQYLDTSKVTSFNRFLFSSTSIINLDISNLNTSNAKSMSEMFREIKKINELDLSSFDTSNVENCLIMFHDIPRNITIKISNKFTKCREQIPYENIIVNEDDLACSRLDNCEKCSGSNDTLQCIKCKTGYQIINLTCIKPKCNLGENEKCSSCQNISDKEDECLECNEGYYLPSNILDKTKCSKCKIEGCKRCDNVSGKCQDCKYNYEPIIDENTGIITNCNLQCEIGLGDKCLACETEKGKEHKCSSCNIGYKLINGQCKKIENSSWEDEDYISYVFPTIGNNEVKIIFNKTLTNMKYLFVGCYDLISIVFNEAFDTSHVLCMHYMFSSCDSLEHINISSFNTSLVGDMDGMFTGCDSLTSLDLSNFDTRNTFDMQCIFAYTEKLSYIDISSFDTTYLDYSGWMFEDLPENGTVIIGKKFNHQSELPNTWKIITK